MIEKGVGAAADAAGKRKTSMYSGKIDEKTSIFLPFIMETQGGFSRSAQNFMKEVEKRKKQRSCSLSQPPISVANLDLMTSLSLQLQRLNSEMGLQRLPKDQTLEVKDSTILASRGY